MFPVLSGDDVGIPDMFGPWQAARLSNSVDMETLAESLRKEQQRVRKEQRV